MTDTPCFAAGAPIAHFPGLSCGLLLGDQFLLPRQQSTNGGGGRKRL